MRFRKLRIAWSVGWGIVAVLLIVLWYDSYQSCRCIDARYHRLQVTASTLRGIVGINLDSNQTSSGAGTLPPVYCHWAASAAKNRDYGLVAQPTLTFLQCRYVHDSSCYELDIPFGMLTFFAASIAAIPWITWSSRFSLRTLLIAITLVAVVLGLLVWLLSP